MGLDLRLTRGEDHRSRRQPGHERGDRQGDAREGEPEGDDGGHRQRGARGDADQLRPGQGIAEGVLHHRSRGAQHGARHHSPDHPGQAEVTHYELLVSLRLAGAEEGLQDLADRQVGRALHERHEGDHRAQTGDDGHHRGRPHPSVPVEGVSHLSGEGGLRAKEDSPPSVYSVPVISPPASIPTGRPGDRRGRANRRSGNTGTPTGASAARDRTNRPSPLHTPDRRDGRWSATTPRR